jgi:hypothetical protein
VFLARPAPLVMYTAPHFTPKSERLSGRFQAAVFFFFFIISFFVVVVVAGCSLDDSFHKYADARPFIHWTSRGVDDRLFYSETGNVLTLTEMKRWPRLSYNGCRHPLSILLVCLFTYLSAAALCSSSLGRSSQISHFLRNSLSKLKVK